MTCSNCCKRVSDSLFSLSSIPVAGAVFGLALVIKAIASAIFACCARTKGSGGSDNGFDFVWGALSVVTLGIIPFCCFIRVIWGSGGASTSASETAAK